MSKNMALEYYKTYEKDVYQILQSFEPERKRIVARLWNDAFLIFIGILALIFINISLFRLLSEGYLFGGWIFFAIFITITADWIIPILLLIKYITRVINQSREFRNKIKYSSLEKILNVFGDIKWENKSGSITNKKQQGLVTNKEIDASGLFIPYNTREIDDEFQGVYKDVEFRISETTILDIHGSGKNRSVIEVFKGVIVIFNCNKKVKNRTLVTTKGSLTQKSSPIVASLLVLSGCPELFKGGYEHWKVIFLLTFMIIAYIISAKLISKEEPLHEVILEDPQFNKKFNVYSSDQIEARYLITPSFMERFYKLKTAFGVKQAKCSFFNDKLMFALPTRKNLFEIGGLSKSLENKESINNFYEELSSILKMVEYFKLDEKMGL